MDKLVTAAIVGTGQQKPETFTTGTAVDSLATQLPVENSERSLLLAAGSLAVYRQAGYRAPQASTPPAPAPEETRSAYTKEVAYLLDQLIKDRYDALIPEALARLQAASLRIPHEMLPQLLQYGSDHKAVRAALLPLLGERGRWLSQFNAHWDWVQQFLAETGEELPADAETLWQEGTIGQRGEILRRLRAVDPGKARDWLAEVWKQEKAEARNALLATLKVNLTAEDEAFLETALDDRSATVKATAVALLACIPGSALSKRMLERADNLLSFEKKAFNKGTLSLNQQLQPDAQWKHDGLGEHWEREKKETQQKIRFYEVVEKIMSLIPPDHWTERFATTPEILLDALKDRDDSVILLDTWSQATSLHRVRQWAGSLIARQLSANKTAILNDLLQLLSPEEIEQQLSQLSFKEDWLADLLDLLPRPWSEEFSELSLRKIRVTLEARKKLANSYYYTDKLLNSITVAIPFACFEQARQLGDLHEEDPQKWTTRYINEKLDESLNILKMRERIIKEIHA